MTVTAGHATSGPAAPAPPAGGSGPAGAPRLAEGVELLGEYKDSGYSQPPSLVRRPDGQVIQMSALLYRVTSRIDGARDAEAIAGQVSADLGRTLTADQVRYLITAKLEPLGIVAGQDAPAAPPVASPLLALRARGTLLPEHAVNIAGALLRPLFRWPVIAAVAAAVGAVDWWLFAVHGLGGGFRQILRNPVDLLIVLGLSVLSAAFHECGHAAGCRYGGARPGVIGVGIYLVWPAFFTNTTDAYRLSRAGRLRTDLGGLYFNAVFMLALAGLVHLPYSPLMLVTIIAEMALLAMVLTAFGAMIASRMQQVESFQVVMQLFVMPLFFLSGAVFPITSLPAWLGVLTKIDPLTYAVDAIRRTLFAHIHVPAAAVRSLAPGVMWGSWRLPTLFELAIVALLGAVMMSLAISRFAKTE